MSQPRGMPTIGSTEELNRIQDYIVKTLTPLLNSAIGNGVLLRDLQLAIGTNEVAHKLGRVPQGWIVVDKNLNEDICSTAKTRNLLTLETSGAVTVSLWIF